MVDALGRQVFFLIDMLFCLCRQFAIFFKGSRGQLGFPSNIGFTNKLKDRKDQYSDKNTN